MFSLIRRIWLVAMFVALLAAQLVFPGSSSSDVAGNLAFALLVLCLPVSFIAYPTAFELVSVAEPLGLLPYNSRLALTAWWGVFLLLGVLQWWIFVPSVWRRHWPNKPLQPPRAAEPNEQRESAGSGPRG